jgi:site-specific DNA-adenine methylase
MLRYSGSKRRLLKFLPGPPLGTTTIVEPFAGSLAYALHYQKPKIVAAEANPLVRDLWCWFRNRATEADFTRIESLKPKEKIDARVWAKQHDLGEPETTLVRLQISGAYVGQLSSFSLYPQHSLGLQEFRNRLSYIKRSLAPVRDDFRHPEILAATKEPNAFAFVDPPYLDTKANYKSKGQDHGSITPQEVEDFILGLSCPTLVTYGDGAQETFPRLTWTKAVTRKVPILRGGGTRERTEWYSRIGF